MISTTLIPWLDPAKLIDGFGAFALLGICFIVFAETGLLVGFLFPGDTLLIITGVLAFPPLVGDPVINIPIALVCLAIGLSAFLGGEAGYLIGHKFGPRIFERKESGLFSTANVVRTNAFFERYGAFAVIIARFVPIVRTFAPVAAGVGHMNYKKYTLYNLIGAFVWGAGVTFAGYLLGYIPPVQAFVEKYIDVILLGAVALTLIPTVYHYVQASMKAKKARQLASVDTAALVLDTSVFDQEPSPDAESDKG